MLLPRIEREDESASPGHIPCFAGKSPRHFPDELSSCSEYPEIRTTETEGNAKWLAFRSNDIGPETTRAGQERCGYRIDMDYEEGTSLVNFLRKSREVNKPPEEVRVLNDDTRRFFCLREKRLGFRADRILCAGNTDGPKAYLLWRAVGLRYLPIVRVKRP